MIYDSSLQELVRFNMSENYLLDCTKTAQHQKDLKDIDSNHQEMKIDNV